ncbi:hypothetical protein TeGR_g9782 [Tetraparma gracilis]|uniref:Plastid lipid-associated protein/fibrillin conserved domain-containing protein n=1 Tax=Tetraparma gracilis TaxID=2962635 RepID=A0ABQ6N275_9STRA|nr:hypothetical protein TeGR_g9782 [Tetraparma gracilis]
MRQTKTEMLSRLLLPPSPAQRSALADSLATLVRSNPVSTTTDSNLLDGRWSLACVAGDAAGVLSRGERGPKPKRPPRIRTPLLSSSTSLIELESSNPSLSLSTSYLFGLLSLSSINPLTSLTRTSFSTLQSRRRLKLLSLLPLPLPPASEPLDLEVLYLDTDLCVTRARDTLSVHTKNLPTPTPARRVLALFRPLLSLPLALLRLPLRLRRAPSPATAYDRIAALTPAVRYGLQIGDVGSAAAPAAAYDVRDDPLGHLTEDERQERMAGMSIGEVRRMEGERVRREERRARGGGG